MMLAAAAGGPVHRRDGYRHLEEVFSAATRRSHHLPAAELRVSHKHPAAGQLSSQQQQQQRVATATIATALIAVGHGSFNRIHQLAPIRTAISYTVPWDPARDRVDFPSGVSVDSAVFQGSWP